MQLLKKTILASVFTALLPVGIFAQTEEVFVEPEDEISYWAEDNGTNLRAEQDLLWSAYVTSVENEAYNTNYGNLYQKFTADFLRTYGFHPQQASISHFRDYYAQHKNDYGGDLLLPTMAIWYKRPFSSIIPIPEDLDAYWSRPDQAAETYDFMAAIDREDAIWYVGTYMGAYYGHPTNQGTLKNFWKKWLKRDDSSAAKQDIARLKRTMLDEILSHEGEYAVYELASKEQDLWPQLAVDPVSIEEQNLVQNIISNTCTEDNPTEDCERFIKYANTYHYINDGIPQQIQERLVILYPHIRFSWYYPYYDDWYFYSRRPFYRPRPPLPPYRPHFRPHRPGHRPPVIHPGDKPPHRPGHNPGGKPGDHKPPHRPGHNPGGNHGGNNGGNPPNHPGHNPGHNPGGTVGNGTNPPSGGNNGGNHNPNRPGGTIHNGRPRPSTWGGSTGSERPSRPAVTPSRPGNSRPTVTPSRPSTTGGDRSRPSVGGNGGSHRNSHPTISPSSGSSRPSGSSTGGNRSSSGSSRPSSSSIGGGHSFSGHSSGNHHSGGSGFGGGHRH